MTTSICDPVSSALHLSLKAEESQNSSLLDSRLYSSAKTVLLSKIEFEESGDYQSKVLDGLKSKYVVIRPKKQIQDIKLLEKEVNSTSQSISGPNSDEGLPTPKIVLFPVENVQLGWQSSWTTGAGMQNMGNTCYLNSTLQALFHVPAFANWLVSEAFHSEECKKQDTCVICGMRATLMSTQKNGIISIKPWQVYSKLSLICRHLTPGNQEDAHEFLRYLVEAMEKCYLSRFVNSNKLDQFSKETTPLNQILGGYLRSTVRCPACEHLSTTYQHFQDLLLDIRKHSTLNEALDSFFSSERLEERDYQCEACNKKVSATKQFFIERAPMVLCIALKRFSIGGGKLSKNIQFGNKINLSNYMYNQSSPQKLSYKLVSLVAHFGHSQNCGHYIAVGQAPNNGYYQFDDGSVRPLPLSSVMGNSVYVMFFEKEINKGDTAASSSKVVYGPHLSGTILHRERSPLKLSKNYEKRPIITNNCSNGTKPEVKPFLNTTLNKSMESNNCKSEPRIVKQNIQVEKVTSGSKIFNGSDKPNKEDNDKKVGSVIKKQSNDNGFIRLKFVEKSKLVQQKTPLEKLEEQMNEGDALSHIHRNGHSKLVPYDSESSSDERSEKVHDDSSRKPKPSRCVSQQGLIVTTKAMHHAWTVSNEKSGPLLSPSLNGDTIRKIKDKENGRTEDGSPNSSVSSMSPPSDHSERAAAATGEPPAAASALPSLTAPPGLPSLAALPGPAAAPAPSAASLASPASPASPAPSTLETARHLHGLSHRGYGAPVSSWNGTHSSMSRQVFEERRDQCKRAHEASDDMDSGRHKKVKRFHHYNRFNNNRNGYNPFQERQNKLRWGNNFKCVSDRHPTHHYNKHHSNKYKRSNRYTSTNGHHYRHR